jgi:alkyl hydroperoxide reductase subunit F
MYDIMIIGAGPAGMTAAVYAARKKLNTLLLSEDIGGQINIASGSGKYESYQILDGNELIRKFEDQLKQFPVDRKTAERVITISAKNGAFQAKTANDKVYEARTVVVATGRRPRRLNVPGEYDLTGRGVSYCVACDGPLFAGMKVAVIGDDNAALEAADDMVKIAEHVYIITSNAFSSEEILINRLKKADNVTIFEQHEVTEIAGDKFVESIKLRDPATGHEEELKIGGVIIEMGLIPSSDFARGLLALNQKGEIEVDCAGATSVAGIYAAGDVTNIPEKQLIIASGAGAKATLQANRYMQRLTT